MKTTIKNLNLKHIIILLSSIIVSIASGTGLGIIITPKEDGSIEIETGLAIQLAEVQKPAFTTDTTGNEIPTDNIVTVDEIDSNQKIEDLDFGIGETYPVDTPQAFKDATYSKCIDLDHKYGSQCVDLANAFWSSYTGRWISTCGTGLAKGMMNCADQNAGNDFEIYWKDSTSKIQAGDWLVFDGSSTGHICMAMGNIVDGYVTCLGENQGGKVCEGGGAATNIINISVKNLIGFYRPKIYIKPDPTPLPISNCVRWHVQRGDTMSKIMLECEGTVVYGEPMNAYARTWFSLVYNKGKSVYEGWSSPQGVGLYENDDIEHRI